ncbi:MAG: helix-turn-helix domain-containing protein [Thermomicrobiales bacterium]
MHDDRLIPVSGVAKRLGRSTEQVRRYLREGTLQGVRIGQQWFVESDVLDAFQNRVKERKSFLQKLKTASQTRALDDVIGIGDGPGSNLGEGKDEYRKSAWWRR